MAGTIGVCAILATVGRFVRRFLGVPHSLGRFCRHSEVLELCIWP